MRTVTILLACLLSASCGLYYRGGIRLFYREADLPAGQIRRNVPYAGPASTPRQRLNLFLPAGREWPLVVFVHGGRWDEGDRDLEVGGADVYNNIGRYLATQGIGAAVVGYRLLPEVPWQAQAADVASAVHWAGAQVSAYGGDPRCVFVMGHSAGAQLAARVALDPDAQGAGGEPLPPICGVIAVSGAGYDMADRRTYDLGNDPRFYEQRFGGTADWPTTASPVRFIRAERAARIPPFLVLYAGGETKALQRQSQLLHATLLDAGVPSTILVVPGESHTRIVLALSRNDKVAGPAIVRFVRRLAGAPRSGRPAAPRDTAGRRPD